MATLITAQPKSVVRYLNPVALGHSLWRHRQLIRQFAWREVQGRYRGSFLGLFWSFINPLVLLLIYTFVFGLVLQTRWPQARTDNLSEFALLLFCGLTGFNIFSECVGRAPALIVGVPNYVKKVVFPLELLPVSVLVSALFHALVSLCILLAANLLIMGAFHWTLALLPLVMLPLLFLSLGFSWFLASLGVFVRDINYIIGLIIQVLLFMSAIFYSIDIVPEPFQTFIRLNPLASILENFRRVILWGSLPSWPELAISLLIGGVVMMLGYTWFMKTKKGFADVI